MANEPPSKRMKKEIAETNHNNSTEQTTLAKFTEKRKNFGKSEAEFKFNKKRVRLISSNCGDFANVTFANVFGRFANAMSRFANVLLVTSPTPNI